MYSLICEKVTSMYELKCVYNLEEALKLYDILSMQHDIESAMMQESRRRGGDD